VLPAAWTEMETPQLNAPTVALERIHQQERVSQTKARALAVQAVNLARLATSTMIS